MENLPDSTALMNPGYTLSHIAQKCNNWRLAGKLCDFNKIQLKLTKISLNNLLKNYKKKLYKIIILITLNLYRFFIK